MTPPAPGTYRVMSSDLAGGGQVALVCKECWCLYYVLVKKLPKSNQSQTLAVPCERCETKALYTSEKAVEREAHAVKAKLPKTARRRPEDDCPLFGVVSTPGATGVGEGDGELQEAP